MRHRRSHDRQSTHLRWRGASPHRFCEGCRRSWPTHHLYGTSGDRDAPPVDAAGILLLPSFVTNVWQMLAGRTLRIVFRRLWPMMFAVCAGTWTGLGLMTGASAKFGTALLGVAPAIYAITGLGTLRLSAPRAWEPNPYTSRWRYHGINYSGNGRLRGTRRPLPPSHRPREGGTGPGAGLSFTVSTLALAVNVGVEGGLQVSMGRASIVPLASDCMGMWIGQSILQNMLPNAFRRWFFLSLLLLGLYLAACSAI